MLLLANLFGTTVDELVRGDVDEMREMVEKNERKTKTYAVALAAVEVVVVTALAVTAVAGRDYLEPVLRLLLAGLAVGIGVLVAGDVLLDGRAFLALAVVLVATAAVVLLAFWAIGRRRRG